MDAAERLATRLVAIYGDERIFDCVQQLARAVLEGQVCIRLSDDVIEKLNSSAAVSSIVDADLAKGFAALRKPLVLVGNQLYFYRHWRYEQRLAQHIRWRCAVCLPPVSSDKFPQDEDQAAATRHAMSHSLTLITGGPGTGKTYTLAQILRPMVAKNLRVALAAPTGKAAARINDVMKQAGVLAPPAQTLHRLLGLSPFTSRPRYRPNNPLDVDVLAVDEASMIDLAVMTFLLEALPPSARLILLGDPHQLASVEAGNVLFSLCNAKLTKSFRVELKNSHRVEGQTLLRLAALVREGQQEEAIEILGSGEAVISWCQDSDRVAVEKLMVKGFDVYRDLVRSVHHDETSAFGLLQELLKFRVLCAHRTGEMGTAHINHQAEKFVARRNHHPILITANDSSLGLFNGDTGVVLGNKAYFPSLESTLRVMNIDRLPPHEIAYAITVHKSQGSEFDEVALCLPQESPLLNRALLYTSITRARKKIQLFATQKTVRHAIATPLIRDSGLVAMLDG